MNRSTRFVAALFALAASGSCTGDPTAPTTVAPPTSGGGTGSSSLSGTVVGYFDGAPVVGATIINGNAVTATDASGAFTLNGVAGSGSVGIVVNATGHVYRRVVYDMTPNRAGVKVDVIRDSAPFDLLFYRAWARDFIQSQSFQATKPWTVDPSFYFQTKLLDADEVVPDSVIDRMVAIFANSVPELSGGRRKVGAVERGTEAREAADGWVNVVFARNLGGVLGRSSVGGNSGTMTLLYAPLLVSTPQNNPFGCDFYMYGIADHEITHTMGFYHTFDTIADSFSGSGCTGTGRPERTRIHSAIMYSRPPGNTDPDVDPASSAQLVAPLKGIGPVVECFRQ